MSVSILIWCKVVSLNDCRSAAELRREDSLVPFMAFDWYPRDLYNAATSRTLP